MAAVAMLFPGATVAAHATPAACSERLLPPSGAATGQQQLTARDLVEIRDFGDISLSPDGKWAALIVRRADSTRDDYCIGVILVPLSGGAPRLIDVGGELPMVRSDLRGVADITNGSPLGNAPVWSPDGRSVAYLRRDRGITQVWIASTDGHPRQLTRLVDDARGVEWASPTAVSIRLRRTGQARAEIEREGRSGYLYDRRFWAISEARPGPPVTPLTTITLDARNGEPVANRNPPSDLRRPAGARLFTRLANGGIAWTEAERPPRYAGPTILQAEAGGSRASCGAPCSSRIVGLWALGTDELLFLRAGSADNGGRTELYSWQLTKDAAPRRVLTTDDALSSCDLSGGRLICGHETSRHPRSLVAINPDNGTISTLYDPNPELAPRIRSKVERLRWTGPEGVSSYGDLVLPPDHRPGQRHPLIIVQYSSDGFLRGGVGDEYPVHLFAAQGFAVLSVTRPPAPARETNAADADSYQRTNVKDWADRRRVLASLEAGIDTVLKRQVVDPARIGITGLSDGSSTVQFALLNSKRFAAAAISTCCESAGALASVGLAYSDSTTRWGYPPPGTVDPDFWEAYSLAANATRMRTPLLIQVADREYRLALETYAALDHAQAPVEMYVFPDEHHVKSHPEHRLAIYERNLAWFDFWLNKVVRDDPEDAEAMKRWQALKLRVAP